jgi:hypothetical protein
MTDGDNKCFYMRAEGLANSGVEIAWDHRKELVDVAEHGHQ